MTKTSAVRGLVSSLIVSTSLMACSGTQMQQRPAFASDEGSVEQALGARQFERALANAEELVAAKPADAASRTLLGRAYLANGRFMSARAAFDDAMTLGARDTRTIVSLALVDTALGNANQARALLSEHISDLPAADYGLGMAVAGDANEGVRALLEAVRQPDADAKTRQNLAYALALSGNWAQARLVAGQDLDGSQLQLRLTHWAATAQGNALPQRVAALVGVAPRADDAGMPARLALQQSGGTDVAAAGQQPSDMVASAVTEAQEQQPAPSAVVQVVAPQPAVAPAPVAMAIATAVQAQTITPFIPAPSTPMRQPAVKHTPSAVPALAAPPRGGSDWVVQIGAYDNNAVAETGWKQASARLPALHGYRKVSGTVSISGKTWHRLAVSGFGDRKAAVQLCATLNRQGQDCFVRRDESIASTQRMASQAKTAKLASR
jgi:Flp pilus assembly protein TadD/cell division protein FtsN